MARRAAFITTASVRYPLRMLIRDALTDADISRCHNVMAELRPHVPRDGFVERIRRQMTSEGGNYRLAFAEDSSGT